MNLVKPEPVTTTGAITRSTVGTYFDIAGVMQTAAIDAVRINYDPYSHEFLGLLIENAATNLLTYSAQFDSSAWNKPIITVAANAFVAPDGTLTADKLVESTSTIAQRILTNQSYTLPAGAVTFSFYAKFAGRRYLNAYPLYTTWWNFNVLFDLQTGVITANPTSTPASITPVGNGWYRCSVSPTVTTGGTGATATIILGMQMNGTLGGSDSSYTGDGSSGIYLWGAQLEAGASATSYIPTVASSVTRAADIITGSGLVYTNLTNAYAEWSSGTTYALGTSVSYGILGTYISLQNSNLNQNPVTATAYWSRTGPTNKMAAFDDQISSISSSNSDIIFAVTASSIDTVALLNIVGSKTSIAVTDISLKSEIYHNSQQLTGIDSLDWYSYFFYDQDTVRTLSVYLDIPVVSSGLVTVKISGAGTNSLGTFIAGLLKRLGDTQYGVSAGIIDYSRKDTDEFGNVTFIKRNYSKRINASVSLTNANLNKVQRILYQIRATPVLWLASTDIQFEEPLITYGFYRDFSTEISYPTHSICNLQIEGLI